MESADVSDENNADVALSREAAQNSNPQRTQLLNKELDSSVRRKLETAEVNQDDLLSRIGETATKLAVLGKSSEDDGFSLKVQYFSQS